MSESLERVWVANCGMPDVLVLGDQGVRERIRSAELPLGVHDNLDLGDCMRMIPVSRGERLLLTSDGIQETMNGSGEQFGSARLEHAATQSSGVAAQRVKDALVQFRGDEPIADDSSLVEVHLVPDLFGPMVAQEAADSVASSQSDASGQWRLAFELHADALRVTDPVPMLLSQLQHVPGIEQHRSVLYTVLSELYSNALDHGVLRLSSSLKDLPDGFERYLEARERQLTTLSDGWVSIKAVCARWPSGGQLTIEIEDSGDGFDWRAAAMECPPAGAHGRGLHLVRSLCQTVSFEGAGNRVQAVYVWGKADSQTLVE